MGEQALTPRANTAGAESAVPDDDKPSGPRSKKGALTRARLLQAAKEVFEDNGFLDARISDISERAGLSHGSFYHYFDSKEEIFREVAAEVELHLSEPMDDIILDASSHATPTERISRALRQHFESYRESARIMGVIEQVSRYDDHLQAVRATHHDRWLKQVADSIHRLQRHGLADPTLDPVIAAAVVGSMTTRFPELWFVEHRLDCDFDEGVQQLTRIFLNALRVERTPEEEAAQLPKPTPSAPAAKRRRAATVEPAG